MYKKPNAKPNQGDVAQILDLEFKARRAFIDADITKEEDRPTKVFEAYPCFRVTRNAMDELRRIVGGTNCKYIEETKGRWADFCAKVQFYGVWKKALKPPFPLDLRGGVTKPPEMVSVGNGVPKRFLHECISEHSRDGYEEMVLSTLASVDTVRGGALKYLALVRASTRNVSSLHTIVALAMTGWQRSLLERSSEKSCTCGVWAQAVELISCSSERTGAGLRIRVQRPARLGLGRGRRGGYARLDSVARSQRRRGLRTLLSS
ncbi:hypothetical protein F2P81_013144 [Scophthalmus maximus]|uniref:Uncharacterized protein n=1 Tax=Scophthalmus maximus TaxID=52904 RepID=A0A6A4SJK1_SCOMX|nr:hypothetical protein F2P81_013144 [Scophthalmus maximus]